jgi:hypothetical protein
MAHAATAMRTGKGLRPSLTLRSFIVPFQRAKLPAAISRWDDFLAWQERGRAIHGLDPAAEIAIPSGYQAAVNAQTAQGEPEQHGLFDPRHAQHLVAGGADEAEDGEFCPSLCR